MAALFQSAMYLSGGVISLILLFLPAVFLLTISAIYIIFEAVQIFRHGL